MFKVKEEINNHTIYTYDKEKYNFTNFFQELYDQDDLENLHLKSEDYIEYSDRLSLGVLSDFETDLHKKFYQKIKQDNTFKREYCKLIKDIFDNFFPEEDVMIYQTFPSVRFQFPESVSVPPHKDSDNLSNHPLGEKNFLIPITEMKNTNTIFIETEPDKKDFKNIDLKSGELFFFNGNTCTHFNKNNK